MKKQLRILRRLIDRISPKDRNWSFEVFNAGLVHYGPHYGLLKNTDDYHRVTPILIAQDLSSTDEPRTANTFAAYVAACSPEKIEQFINSFEQLERVSRLILESAQESGPQSLPDNPYVHLVPISLIWDLEKILAEIGD